MTEASRESRKWNTSSGGKTRTKRGRAAVPRTLPFLLEVGCEEIPARFLQSAAKHLGEQFRAALVSNRLLLGPYGRKLCGPADAPLVEVRTFFTPRRLVAYIRSVLPSQLDIEHHIEGPPMKVAVGPDGRYTRAAEAFVARNGAKLEDLRTKQTPRGDYLELVKTDPGAPAMEVLPKLLQALLWNLGFPKSMYWERTEGAKFRFVRPIRWILALLGEGAGARVVPLEIPGRVKSGDFTFGHRAKSRRKLHVTGFMDYRQKLRRAHVLIDPADRRVNFLRKSKVLLNGTSLILVQDKFLEDWVVNSTEWPTAMLGSFDERFLHLPREILITVMRDHQKYFAVEDGQGSLRPHFVAVLNMDSDKKGLICQGHERVLAARFRDAEFFWGADQRVPLRDREPLLDKVTYQAELGTYADKVKRMLRIGDSIRALLEKHDPGVTAYTVAIREAIRLCKCDLTTQMVQEFPELQGIVGGLYAAAQREPKEIADAIYDHYLPQSAEDRCPRSLVGAIASIVDKFDSVVAGFAVGHEPTSSGDPFALRRQGNGIIKVLLEFGLPIDLDSLVQEYHIKMEHDGWLGLQTSVPWGRVLIGASQFFTERLCYHLESVRGLRFDTVRAVLAAAPKLARFVSISPLDTPKLDGIVSISPLDALRRAEALEALRGREDLEALCAAAKRIRNILVKSATAVGWEPGEVEAVLLKEPPERELFEVYSRVAKEAGRRRESYDYRGALEEISTLRPAVDRFFDGVLVMAEEPEIRQNRLRLLKKLDELFSGIAHFAEIEAR